MVFAQYDQNDELENLFLICFYDIGDWNMFGI